MSAFLVSWEAHCLLPGHVSDLAATPAPFLAARCTVGSQEAVRVAGVHRRRVAEYDLFILDSELYSQEGQVEKMWLIRSQLQNSLGNLLGSKLSKVACCSCFNI